MDIFLNNTKKIIFTRQKDILSSTIIISMMILASTIFGLIRLRTLATYFTTQELDIFLAAFRIPDFIFETIITGAVSSAFIPIFVKYKTDKEKLHTNISSIINVIMLAMIIFIVFMLVFAHNIIPMITPGFNKHDMPLVIQLSQLLLLLQLPFLVSGGLLSGIGQANKIFIASAIAPVLYNVGIILGTIFFAPSLGLGGPVLGVCIGGVLLFLVQLPILFITKFQYKPFMMKKPIIKEFFTLFSPRVLTVVTRQIDLTVDLSLSTLLGAGSYTVFYFAQRIQLFPVSFVGMAFGQASLPYLSELFSQDKISEIKKIFVDSLLQLLYISIPLAFLLIFARTPIVRVVVGGKKFDWQSTNLTALTLSIFALSIPFHAIFYYITRCFYAVRNTKTPFIINALSTLINIFISLYMVVIAKFPVWSLALSFSIAIMTNVTISLILFHKEIGGYDVGKLISHSLKIYAITLISALPAYAVLRLFDLLIITPGRTLSLFFLLGLVVLIYFVFYLLLSWLMNIEEMYVLTRLSMALHGMKKKLAEVYTNSEN